MVFGERARKLQAFPSLDRVRIHNKEPTHSRRVASRGDVGQIHLPMVDDVYGSHHGGYSMQQSCFPRGEPAGGYCELFDTAPIYPYLPL